MDFTHSVIVLCVAISCGEGVSGLNVNASIEDLVVFMKSIQHKLCPHVSLCNSPVLENSSSENYDVLCCSDCSCDETCDKDHTCCPDFYDSDHKDDFQDTDGLLSNEIFKIDEQFLNAYSKMGDFNTLPGKFRNQLSNFSQVLFNESKLFAGGDKKQKCVQVRYGNIDYKD